MVKEGYYNEIKFVNELNNKFIWQLSDKFILLLKKLFGCNIRENDFVLCWKSFKTDKADIIICINNKKKNISIKNGKNNSVHLEKISDFIEFLKENKISDELIDIYYNYHYACDNYGNRISAKQYQENHVMEIQKINKVINKNKILLKAINRFLFKGIYKQNNRVDCIIYGTVEKFSFITYAETVNYLLNCNEKFDSIHFSLLTLQPWTRNLNNNQKYEYRRDYVQVKWYRLEEVIQDISKR